MSQSPLQTSKRVPCPFCAEEILPQAIKCRHCGEWLKSAMSENSVSGNGMSRAVTKGLEQKQRNDAAQTPHFIAALIVGLLAGAIVGGIFDSTILGVSGGVVAMVIAANFQPKPRGER